jgi:hypothetical protein
MCQKHFSAFQKKKTFFTVRKEQTDFYVADIVIFVAAFITPNENQQQPLLLIKFRFPVYQKLGSNTQYSFPPRKRSLV